MRIAVTGFALCVAAPAFGQAQQIDIPDLPLGDALRLFAELTGREVIASAELVAGKRSRPVSGAMTPAAAMTGLLAGTGLDSEQVDGAFVIRRLAATDPEGGALASEIVVTGSRLAGTRVASPVVEIGREDMRDGARADLGEVVRRIPQNFGGGQNPGIGSNVPEASGVDVGGSSSINLRGLGSDATLTLLNGRRLVYSAALQSVDISAIPIGAVERIEVVPDGASAIYGSDAIAGVANVILRRDFAGLETGARIAATSDGGGFQQRYDAVAGERWRGGGLMLAYEYGSNGAIRGSQRSYAEAQARGLDLFPALRRHALAGSMHQSFGSGWSASLDGLFNVRRSRQTQPTSPDGDADASRIDFASRDTALAFSPTVRLELDGGWTLELAGTYGRQRVNFRNFECVGADCVDTGRNFYQNTARSLELGGSGDVLTLPGGTARLAVGAGYRRIGFRRFSERISAANTDADQESYFAYGELALPLVGPDAGLPLLEDFDLSLAGRYENYPGIGDIFTPKIGAIWGMTADVSVKASWGESFRAPTLFQAFQQRNVFLAPAALVGGGRATPNATALVLTGGNPELKPERAETWSATLAVTPRALPGASLEISYFDVRYRDRVVVPINRLAEALTNPLFADQVTRMPSPAAQADLLARVDNFLNFTGIAYDPANVVALIDNAFVNAGRQSARGVDMLARYAATVATGQRLTFSANLSYLDSEQQLTAEQAVQPLAGTIFHPPHWRGQTSLGWQSGPVTLTADALYLGGVRDVRLAERPRVEGMTTLDLSLRYRVPASGGPLAGLEVTAAVQNLFNAKPDLIATNAPFETPYDSTNYSPIGRLVALEVRRSW